VGKMKIELDEKTIDNIVDYAINHPQKIRKLIKLVGEETLSVLKERHIIDEGAKLYREITGAINLTYKKD
jgi:tagatose-1,6-bisphosphate aldolase